MFYKTQSRLLNAISSCYTRQNHVISKLLHAFLQISSPIVNFREQKHLNILTRISGSERRKCLVTLIVYKILGLTARVESIQQS
jgi:hypothetical protein